MAFAGFTTSLAAEGMATFQAHIYDYVYITGIRISGNNNASSVNYSFLDHEMSATVMAPTCDGYVEYKIDIVNTTPYKAFITAQGITSQINGTGSNTNTLSTEFTDVTLNDTSQEAGSGGGYSAFALGTTSVSSTTINNGSVKVIAGGGGGGSSFLASDVTYSGLSSTITSKLRGTNPSSTGGAVIVTWIGKTM